MKQQISKHDLIKERNQGIGRLHNDIVIIKGLMDDLALLADDQDILYDNIESNIQYVTLNTVIANKELEKANDIHRKKSKWKLLGGIGGSVGGITAILVTLGILKKL